MILLSCVWELESKSTTTLFLIPFPGSKECFEQQNTVKMVSPLFPSDSNRRSFVCVRRITTTVACNMDLTKYPMDKQTCTLQLESCKHFTAAKEAEHGGRQTDCGWTQYRVKQEAHALSLCHQTILLKGDLLLFTPPSAHSEVNVSRAHRVNNKQEASQVGAARCSALLKPSFLMAVCIKTCWALERQLTCVQR